MDPRVKPEDDTGCGNDTEWRERRRVKEYPSKLLEHFMESRKPWVPSGMVRFERVLLCSVSK